MRSTVAASDWTPRLRLRGELAPADLPAAACHLADIHHGSHHWRQHLRYLLALQGGVRVDKLAGL